MQKDYAKLMLIKNEKKLDLKKKESIEKERKLSKRDLKKNELRREQWKYTRRKKLSRSLQEKCWCQMVNMLLYLILTLSQKDLSVKRHS